MHTHMHTHTCTHTCTHMHTHMHTHAHTHAHTCTHAHMHTHAHTHTCTHTHMHTHKHTHAHTHMHTHVANMYMTLEVQWTHPPPWCVDPLLSTALSTHCMHDQSNTKGDRSDLENGCEVSAMLIGAHLFCFRDARICS